MKEPSERLKILEEILEETKGMHPEYIRDWIENQISIEIHGI